MTIFEARRGMWVVYKGSVAIIDDLRSELEEGATIHIIHPDTGKTVRVLTGIDYDNLRQAKLKEIPHCRRPDGVIGATMGYK